MTDTFDFSGDAFRPSIPMDPDAVLDYTFDWTDWLSLVSDTISAMPSPAPVVITPVGVTVDSFDVVAGRVTVWLSNPSETGEVSVTCRILTAAGREDERTMYFIIIER